MKITHLFSCLAIFLAASHQSVFAQATPALEVGNFGQLLMVGPDGAQQACGLVSLSVQVRIEGDMASTEVVQVFSNPLDRDGEGTFDFQLPAGAAVNRLALEIDGKMVEGEIVERQKARLVYEQIVRQMRDPALMEWQGGDRFKTQVYPIPARGTKRVSLAYLSRLGAEDGHLTYRYQLPPQGSRLRIGQFRFTAQAQDPTALTVGPYDAKVKPGQVLFEAADFAPRGDLVIRAAEPQDVEPVILRRAQAGARQVFSATIRPTWRAGRHTPPRDITILLDSSASQRGQPLAEAKEALQAITKNLRPGDRIRLIAGDVDLRPGSRDYLPAAGAGELLRSMAALQPGGGTDLAALLLAGVSKPAKGRRGLAIYIGDGQASLGELDGDLLAAQVNKAYRQAGLELHALGLGANPALDFLRRLVRENAGRLLFREPGHRLAIDPFLASLDEPMLTRVTLTAPAECLQRIMPTSLPSLARGEAIALSGLLGPKASCQVTLSGSLAGQNHSQTFVLDFSQAKRSEFLPLFWARARIAHLEGTAGDRREIVELSKEFGIMSRYTSWLVLENDEAYKRHQIAQRQKEKRQIAEAPGQTKSQGPLSKQKLKKGQTMSDFIDQFSGDDAGADSGESAERSLARPAPKVMSADPAPPPPSLRPPAESPMSQRPEKKKRGGKMESIPMTQEQLLARAEGRYKSDPEDAFTRAQLVGQMAASGKLGEARALVDDWFAAAKADPERLLRQVVPAIDALPDDDWSQKRRVEAQRLAWEAKPRAAELLVGLVDALKRAGRGSEALELLERERALARTDSERLLALIPAYGRLNQMAAAQRALLEISRTLLKNRPADARVRRVHLNQLQAAGLKQEALAAIVDWRRWAPDFPDLVLEHAALLREAKQPRQAERVLSELVEFNPHDFEARSIYAQALANQGRAQEACAQYTRAVQLNPAKRETFRTMMGLRRSHPKDAQAIQRCIIDGVSRLPVIRDVSIIMLWEDDSADIDMHVIEAGGERVWYQHKESAQGGHLYYDVTDGFGPEVYVLGAGNPGTYHLQVVYYSGSRKTVRGRFIVLRNAGGPEEVRREYPFTLHGANQEKRVPVTVFKLSR